MNRSLQRSVMSCKYIIEGEFHMDNRHAAEDREVRLIDPGYWEKSEKILYLLNLLEALPDGKAVEELQEMYPKQKWIEFSIETFDTFLTKSSRESDELIEAMNLWKAQITAKEKLDEKYQIWLNQLNKSQIKLKKIIPESLATCLPKTLSEEVYGIPKNAKAEIRYTISAGLIATVFLPPPSKGLFSLPKGIHDLTLPFADMTVKLTKPVIANQIFDGEYRVCFRGIKGQISRRNSEPDISVSHFLVSKSTVNFIFDQEEHPSGNSAGVANIELNGVQAKLELYAAPEQLLISQNFNVFNDFNIDIRLCQLRVEGEFDTDLFLFLLFLASGNEFQRIESQVMDRHEVINAVEISPPSYGVLGFSAIERQKYSSNSFRDLCSRVSDLPRKDPKKFSQWHLRVAIHALLLSGKQPVQKSIVDLYQVLDTLAPLHPTVALTAEKKQAFKIQKKIQKKMVNSVFKSGCFDSITSAIRSSPTAEKLWNIAQPTLQPRWVKIVLNPILDRLKNIEDRESAWKDLKKMVDNKRADPSVVMRVKTLITGCGINYDNKDNQQKKVLDLRHRLSHNLASISIKSHENPDGWDLQELIYVQRTLEGWTITCINWFLARKESRQ